MSTQPVSDSKCGGATVETGVPFPIILERSSSRKQLLSE